MQSIQVGENPDATLVVKGDHCTIRDLANGDLTIDAALDSKKIILDGVTVAQDIKVFFLDLALNLFKYVKGFFG